MTAASLEALQRALEEKLGSLNEDLRQALMEGLKALGDLVTQGASMEEAERIVAKAMFNSYLLRRGGLPLAPKSVDPEAVAAALMEKATSAPRRMRLAPGGPAFHVGGARGRPTEEDPAIIEAAEKLLHKVDEIVKKRRESPGWRW